MNEPTLDPAAADELLARQSRLQAEAQAVIDELALLERLAALGEVEQIGSVVSGLMVFPDIDLNVRCDNPTAEEVFDALRWLYVQPRVVEVLYRDETDPRRAGPAPGDERHYFVARYLHPGADGDAGGAVEWKIDISVWTSAEERSQLAHLEELRARLTGDTRLAILWIKDVWSKKPSYPYTVSGWEVYDAVLEHGVRTPGDFAAYLAERGLPAD